MGDSCRATILDGVEIQENGIIRNSCGRVIGRLLIDIDFEGEHIQYNQSSVKDDRESDPVARETGFIEASVAGDGGRPCTPPPDHGVPGLCIESMDIQTSFLAAFEREGNDG